MKRLLSVLFLMMIGSASFAYNCETSYMPSWCSNIAHTWNDGSMDAYIPVWIWHNRAQYDSIKIAHYNELPWGFGVGKHYYDDEGDLHRLFAMGFLDSHSRFEPLAGYSFEKMFRPAANDWKLGLGYTAFVTARSDISHYLPFPAVLPVWSVHYGRFSIEQTYVPGGHNNGNILFTWLRFEF